MKLITQYKGLRKENYILFIGRIVTNLGSMVWPVLTLILTQKLGMTAADASLCMIALGVVELPLSILAGKLADRYNKKMIIVIFDSISILFYCICAFVPLSFASIILLAAAALFQAMEYPAYETLIADISTTDQREKAYSLSYLGSNIGLVASPTIAGILFKDLLWLSFLISGLAIATSTVLIFFFVKNITPVEEHEEASEYQSAMDKNISILAILRQNSVIFVYIIAMAMYWSAYGQWGFLMPIDIAAAHGADEGAFLYGLMNSENCIIVVILTPVITQLFAKVFQTKKFLVGLLMVVFGYVIFRLGIGFIPAYFIAIACFTMGEIFMTIGNGPYVSERIPASHRGRINSIMGIIQQVLGGIAMFAIGNLHTYLGAAAAWSAVFCMLGIGFVMCLLLIARDRKRYPKLYMPGKKDPAK